MLPLAEPDRLVALAEEAAEDVGPAGILGESKAAIAAGRGVVLPKVVVDNGGRTRDRTLDLSRVKGTLSR